MSRFCSMILAIVFSVGSLLAQAPPKVKVLILTGVNNHNWARHHAGAARPSWNRPGGLKSA